LITPEYVQGGTREWLTEEGQVCRLFSHTGLKIVFLWVDGNELPDWGPRDHLLIDLRKDRDNIAQMDKLFSYDGIVLSEAEEAELVSLLEQVEPKLQKEDHAGVMDALRARPRLAATDKYRQALANALAGLGHSDEAAQLALETLASGYCSDETTLDLSLLLDDLGHKNAALFYFCRLGPPSRVYGWCASYIRGNLLDDLGNYRAALNHLTYARKRHNGSGPALCYPDGVRVGPRKPIHGPVAAATKWNSEPSDILNNIGYIHMTRLGAPAVTLPFLQEARQSNPDNFEIWPNLVLCLATLGRSSEAHAALKEARRLFGRSQKLAELDVALTSRQIGPWMVPAGFGGGAIETHRCGNCSATYDLTKPNKVICGGCGGDYRLVTGQGSKCPYCSNSGVVLTGRFAPQGREEEAICPICFAGTLRRKAR
jgi:tetratricopeptide (TPR) repeat protein